VEQPAGPVGRSCEKIDGVERVTGTKLYGADLIVREADLHARVVRSNHAHAEVVSINASEALAIDGVLAVLTHRDVKGTNRQGLIRRDHPVLVEDRVRYRGDAVALVVGRTEAAASAGRDAVKVKYRVLPTVESIERAVAPDAPKLHPEGNVMGGKRIRKGDAETALAESHVVVTETFRTQTVDHAFLDLEAGVARWDGNMLTIRVSGQWVHEERRLIALALGLPVEKVRIVQPAAGGAFGGREDISIQMYVGLAALRFPGKTVALRYDRAESMTARHKRHAQRIEYTLGADREGRLTGARIVVYSDEGAYASTGIAVCRKAASHATGPYRVPHVQVDVFGVHTNNNPTGAMRGFGAAQMAIAYEGMMDRLADKLKLDRVEFRRHNLIRNGDSVTTGQVIPHAHAAECLEAALKQYRSKQAPSGRLPSHLRRGWGVSVICFGLGYGDGFPDASRALVRIAEDGALEVYSGVVDVGQGAENVIAQIAAETLGMELDKTRVVTADTELTPESGSCSATRSTFFTGSAVKIAATELREKLLDVAGKVLGVHPHELELRGGQVRGRFDPAKECSLEEVADEARQRGYELEARGIFKPSTVCEDFETGQSPRAFVTYLFGAHVSQVLVDVETGEVRVERHVACHDVGKAINPQAVRGQIAGGVAQGIGMALMEEVVYRDGRIVNAGFTDYILPTVRDVPAVECVVLESNDPLGPFGAKGVGEPPLIGAVPAVMSAISDAIGVAPHDLPCDPQRVWELLNGR
jgi:CO/xanthine dehydrogenase Mo-binding subunit